MGESVPVDGGVEQPAAQVAPTRAHEEAPVAAAADGAMTGAGCYSMI